MCQHSPEGRLLVIGDHRFPGEAGSPDFRDLASDVQSTQWPLVSAFVMAAATEFGLGVGVETREVWARFCVLTHYLEKLLDEVPSYQRAQSRFEYWQLVTGRDIPTTLDEKTILAYELYKRAVSAASRANIGNDMQELATFSREKSEAVGLDHYMRVILLEAKLFGMLFALLLSVEESQKPRARKFGKWLGYITAGVALRDAAKDLDEDYKMERTLVAPSRIRKVLLRVAGLAVLVWASLHAPLTSVRVARWYKENS